MKWLRQKKVFTRSLHNSCLQGIVANDTAAKGTKQTKALLLTAFGANIIMAFTERHLPDSNHHHQLSLNDKGCWAVLV